MQIPLGPGQRLAPEAAQNRVITPDPNSLNRGAQAIAGAVGHAGDQLLAEAKKQDDALARVKVGNALMDYESQLDTGVSELSGKLKTLEIQPDQGEPAYQEFVQKLEPVRVDGLGPVEQQQMELSMRQLQENKRRQLRGAALEARTGVARSELRNRFDMLESAAARPDADLSQILNRARVEGVQAVGRTAYGVDEWDQKIRAFEQSAYSVNALARIHGAADNPQMLQQVRRDLTDWEGGPYADLNAKNRESLMKTLNPVLDRSIGVAVGQEAVQQALSGSGPVFASIVQAESGGRQLTDAGTPVTSAKGAVGVAQIMPATGPEAAKAAGLPWDPERFKTDINYNRALGEGYFGKLKQTFGGSDVLAVAAYNAGPGKVGEWVKTIGDPRTGEISEEEFIKKIPFPETQKYTAQVLAGAKRDEKPSFGSIAQQIEARTDLTPEQKDIARADVRTRLQWQEDQEKQQRLQNQTQAWDFMVGGGKWQDMDPALVAKLPPKERKELMNYKQNRETDPEVYTLTRDLIANGKEVNLLDIRNKLSNSDFTRLTDLQIKRQTEGPSATSSIVTNNTLFNDALRNAGISSSPKKGSKEARQLSAARMFVDDRIRALEAEQGKKASRDQSQQIIDQAFIEREIEIDWGFDKTKRGFELQPGENAQVTNIDQIPANERGEIVAALKRAGREVTETQILALFNEGNQ